MIDHLNKKELVKSIGHRAKGIGLKLECFRFKTIRYAPCPMRYAYLLWEFIEGRFSINEVNRIGKRI